MRRLIKAVLLTLILILLSVIIFWAVQQNESTHFSCSGRQISLYGNEKLDVHFHFMLDGTQGETIFNGFSVDSTGQRQAVYERSQFTFSRYNNNYYFTSLIFSPSGSEAIAGKYLRHFFPRYLSERDSGFNIEIRKEGGNGYVLIRGDLPILYCTG
ncbi:TPA: hypothetical protein ACKP1B_002963 [Serratia fonticola]